MVKSARLKDKQGIFDTKEVLFRSAYTGERLTYIDLDAMTEQFSYNKNDLTSNDLRIDSSLMKKIGKRCNVMVFDEKAIGIIKSTGIFDEEIIRALRVNLRCIRVALDRISCVDIVVQDDKGAVKAGISIQDLQKITFCDNAWINGSQIMVELASKKVNQNEDLMFWVNKKTIVTSAGVSCFCKQSGVADGLLINDIIERIDKAKLSRR